MSLTAPITPMDDEDEDGSGDNKLAAVVTNIIDCQSWC